MGEEQVLLTVREGTRGLLGFVERPEEFLDLVSKCADAFANARLADEVGCEHSDDASLSILVKAQGSSAHSRSAARAFSVSV
jgi:hypothetical protein